jgi:hypothetical protein
MHKFIYSGLIIIILLSCSQKTIINQKEVNLTLKLTTPDTISLQHFNQLDLQIELINNSSQSIYIPRLIKDSRPYFLIWSIKKEDSQTMGNQPPDLNTFGYGLEKSDAQLIIDSSTTKMTVSLNLKREFQNRALSFEPGVYYIKLFLENYYYNCKDKTYLMWFGSTESNTQKIIFQ